jgi:hypothetical protein
LNLRADTWRVYLGYWVWFACTLGPLYAIEIAAFIIGAATGAITAGLGYTQFAFAVGFSAGAVIVLIGGSALIWAAVHLAPAAANSIEKRRFAFFETWKVSRGLFGPMLGSFVLVWLPFYVLIIVIQFTVLGILTSAVDFQNMAASGADPKQITEQLLRPAVLVPVIALGAIIAALWFLFHFMMIGINARVIMVDRARRAALSPSAAV